jgi:hypothetical protein
MPAPPIGDLHGITLRSVGLAWESWNLDPSQGVNMVCDSRRSPTNPARSVLTCVFSQMTEIPFYLQHPRNRTVKLNSMPAPRECMLISTVFLPTAAGGRRVWDDLLAISPPTAVPGT